MFNRAGFFPPHETERHALLLFSLGVFGNTLEPTAQPQITAPSPAVRRRKVLDVPDTGDTQGPSPQGSPTFPSSPLLPRETQEPVSPPATPATFKSTTRPEKPLIVEGNRLAHNVVHTPSCAEP